MVVSMEGVRASAFCLVSVKNREMKLWEMICENQ